MRECQLRLEVSVVCGDAYTASVEGLLQAGKGVLQLEKTDFLCYNTEEMTTHTPSCHSAVSRAFVTAAFVCMTLGSAAAELMTAQVFNGGGLEDGINIAENIEGPVTGGDARSLIERILLSVLNFLALAAVIAIIVAGIILIVSGGNEESKDRAKRIILYAIIGLLIIFFARLIVGIFTGGIFFE